MNDMYPEDLTPRKSFISVGTSFDHYIYNHVVDAHHGWWWSRNTHAFMSYSNEAWNQSNLLKHLDEHIQWIGTKVPIQNPSMSEFQNQRASIHSFEHDPWDLPLGVTFQIPWN